MEGCGSPAVYESQPGETRTSPMAGTPLREPWSAQMRRRLERRPLTRPDHTEFGPLRPGDLGRPGLGRAPRMVARQWARRLLRLVPLPTNGDGALPTSGRWALAGVVRRLRARGVVTRASPMASSAGCGESPGFPVEPRISLISPDNGRFGGANNAPNRALAGQFP